MNHAIPAHANALSNVRYNRRARFLEKVISPGAHRCQSLWRRLSLVLLGDSLDGLFPIQTDVASCVESAE
ncbi:MAG TPA: hypothetical protein VK463_17075 [Desulfomonilaceae bacterium]|nr:hypothetical protein [Desulfomonilaceae bacterium]